MREKPRDPFWRPKRSRRISLFAFLSRETEQTAARQGLRKRVWRPSRRQPRRDLPLGAATSMLMLIQTKPPKERLPGPFPANRLCPNCGAKLSRYNPGDRCSVHGGWPRVQMVDNVDDLHEAMTA
jgi:hypothetical protein